MKNEPKPTPAAVTPTHASSAHMRQEPSRWVEESGGGLRRLAPVRTGEVSPEEGLGAAGAAWSSPEAGESPSSMRRVTALLVGSRWARRVREDRPGASTTTVWSPG